MNGQVGPPPADPTRADPDRMWAPAGTAMTTVTTPPAAGVPPPGPPPSQPAGVYYGPPPAAPGPAAAAPSTHNVAVWAMVVAAVVLAITAVVVSLIRWSAPTPVATTTTVTAPTAPTFSAADVAAAKKEACAATKTADAPLTSSQHDFLATLGNRGSDEYKQALSNFQTVAMVEIEYMRAHLRPATPSEVTAAINTYLDSLVAIVDADTRELPDSDANKLIAVAKDAGQRVTELCGG